MDKKEEELAQQKKELERLEKEYAENLNTAKKLVEDRIVKMNKRIELIKKQIEAEEKRNHREEIKNRRANLADKKRNEQKRKSRTHELCIIGGEYEKTFGNTKTEKAINFFESIRKVFPTDIQPEEICEWLNWLLLQKGFRDWAGYDSDP